MADYPDGVQVVQVAVTVESEPVIPGVATEVAAGNAARKTTTQTGYVEVAKWTVADLKVGELKEIIILSSDYTKTMCQVTVGSVVWATDWIVISAMPIIFEDLKLSGNTVVKVETKSTTGGSITVDAIIVGKEIG